MNGKTRSRLVLGLLPLVLAGCIPFLIGAVVVGAGTYVWLSGTMRITYGKPYEEVWDASVEAVREMEFRILTDVRDTVVGHIDAQMGDGTDVDVAVKKLDDEVTRVEIRIGVVGDERISNFIREKIDSHLGVDSRPK